MQDVYLVCCLGISNQEFFNLALLRHFLAHYLGLGIHPSNFMITLHSLGPDDNIEAVTAYLRQFGIAPRRRFTAAYDCHAFYEHDFALMATLDRNAWIILVDLDEFVWFPTELPSFLLALSSSGLNLAMGQLVDRIGQKGLLRPINDCPSIWDQFPIRYPVTRRLVKGCVGKTCIFRNYLKPNVGHHGIVNRNEAVLYPDLLPVFHFKWDSTLPAKLEKRKRQYDADPARYPWRHEVDNTLRHIQNNRLVMV